MKIENNEALQVAPVTDLSDLNKAQLESAIRTYQKAFEEPPYQEAFTDEEAYGALQYILDSDGDVVMGKTEEEVVTLAGGYTKKRNIFYIEELAVAPEQQGMGLGRKTLRALIEKAMSREPDALEIRTTVKNERAIALYSSEGFISDAVTETVAQIRQDGKIALDERIYLTREVKEEGMEKVNTLKRAAVVYPSGNTTAVVFDQRLDADREELNTMVMEAWKQQADGMPEIEQCCFVTLPKDERAVARVEMFGGEFCGNATRSVIQLITEGKDYKGLIEVSGVDRPLNFDVSKGLISVEMPLPIEKDLAQEVAEGILVQLDGIAQLVVVDKNIQMSKPPRAMLDELLEQNKYRLAEQPAVGVTYYNKETKQAEFGVWVQAVNIVFDETACGSGTCAIGIASAIDANQSQWLEVIQPSGESINTKATLDTVTGKVVASSISGQVSILYDGELTLS